MSHSKTNLTERQSYWQQYITIGWISHIWLVEVSKDTVCVCVCTFSIKVSFNFFFIYQSISEIQIKHLKNSACHTINSINLIPDNGIFVGILSLGFYFFQLKQNLTNRTVWIQYYLNMHSIDDNTYLCDNMFFDVSESIKRNDIKD